MNKISKPIRIAVQNKGRLMEPSLAYLRKCGLEFSDAGRNLIAQCTSKQRDIQVEILFVRNSDIPVYVNYGVADFGIVGQNVLMERECQLNIVRELGFGTCSMVIAVPADSKMKQLRDLDHERIATSYPTILKKYLKNQRISAAIVEIQGSVEICPKLGLADAIFDISQSGTTLKENGLRVIESVATSQAVLIRNPHTHTASESVFL